MIPNRIKIKEEIISFSKIILYVSLISQFVFSFGFIPSSSMYPNLLVGDIIFKDVLSVGGKTPEIPLQLPIVSKLFPNFYLTWIKLPVFRMPALGTISRGDIVIFKRPTDDSTNATPVPISKREDYIKRVRGKPKDAISIKKGLVYINEEEDVFNNKQQWKFTCHTTNEIAVSVLNKLQEVSKTKTKKGWIYHLTMTKAQHKQFCNAHSHIKLTLFYDPKWTTGYENQMPTYIVPYKGYQITLDEHTLPLYITTLQNKYQKRFQVIKNENGTSNFYLDGEQKCTYTFDEDYYFMKGDNTHASTDSTQFGFVPASYLVAKNRVIVASLGNPTHKIWSIVTFNWRSDRFLKRSS